MSKVYMAVNLSYVLHTMPVPYFPHSACQGSQCAYLTSGTAPTGSVVWDFWDSGILLA